LPTLSGVSIFKAQSDEGWNVGMLKERAASLSQSIVHIHCEPSNFAISLVAHPKSARVSVPGAESTYPFVAASVDGDSNPTNEIQTLVDLGIKKVILTDSACVEDRGWCPDGAKTSFQILEPDINHNSFIGIMVKHSFTNFDCAVTITTLNVEPIGWNFRVICNTPPENGDTLYYFVIN